MPPRKPRTGPVSLSEQLHGDRYASEKQAVGHKRSRSAGGRDAADPDDDGPLPPSDPLSNGSAVEATTKGTRRLIQASRKQAAEEAEQAERPVDDDEDDTDDTGALLARDEYDEGEEGGDDVDLEYDDNESVATTVEHFDDLGAAYGISEEEARLLERLQPATNVQKRNLADIILDKIREKEDAKKVLSAEAAGTRSETGQSVGGRSMAIDGVDPRVRKVYLAIGGVLKLYTAGKIPKAFKILPNLKNWETLVFLTKPHEWSPHAAYAATRIFAAHLNEKMAQRYYSAILFPIVHDSIAKNRTLHPALYMAVRKALFKPTAFYKGFLIPLCQEGECTLKEALIIGSIMQKSHLPHMETAVAIAMIAALPFSSANCVFLRVFVDKKMNLPNQSIDALVKFFHKFCSTHKSENLPVLWHQTLLVFIQRYKEALLPEQVDLIKQVCTAQFHHLITPEVRRELSALARKS